jgi:hypothetical protein
MDSSIGMPILLLTLGMVLGAFLAYSVTIIYKLGFTTYLKMIGQMGKTIAGALAKFAASLMGLLAVSAKTGTGTEASANAARGGILNHRTGKFDDGTDPAGWYEQD